MSLGKRIGEYRRRHNITQEQFADAMGVTSQAVSKWENDALCPDISMLSQLADFFNVSLDRLLCSEEPKRLQVLRNSERKNIDHLVLRIVIEDQEGSNVRINLPLVLIKAGLKMGLPFIRMSMDDRSFEEAVKGIDFNQVIQLAESGLVGNIIEARTAGGHQVRIYID